MVASQHRCRIVRLHFESAKCALSRHVLACRHTQCHTLPSRCTLQESNVFFLWFYLIVNLGSLVGITVVVYVEENVSWACGFGLTGGLCMPGRSKLCPPPFGKQR